MVLTFCAFTFAGSRFAVTNRAVAEVECQADVRLGSAGRILTFRLSRNRVVAENFCFAVCADLRPRRLSER